LPLLEGLILCRETVFELWRWETVFEGIAGRGVGGEHSGVWRFAALNENEGQRHQHGENGDPAPSMGARAMPNS
jgi:hypothetical protein